MNQAISAIAAPFVTQLSPSTNLRHVVLTHLARRMAIGALLGECLFSTANAHANGAFPAVSQLVSDPSDVAHLVLRSNFGLLTTHDRGSTWDLVCEGGIGYQNVEPPIALLADGVVIAALPNGIAHGANTECNFGIAAGVASYVADVARVPSAPQEAVAVSVNFDRNSSQVWRTHDDGATWLAWGSELSDLNAATLDVAGSNGGVVYVSGVSQNGGVTGVLARSDDGGQTWVRSAVPGATKVSAPYIAALAGDDANTVYVRLSGTPGHLLATHDGGQHLQTVLDFAGPFDGFTLSPDGRFALASGRVDGVWRAPTDSLAFERISCARLRCLSWTESGLFACADEFQAGFLVGESRDLGLSFESRLHLSCIRGPLSCAADSSVAQACSAAWPTISEQLGTDCAAANALMPSSACSGAGEEAGASGSSSGSMSIAASAGKSGRLHPRGGSSGCMLGSSPSLVSAWLLGLAPLCWFARRAKFGRAFGKHSKQ